MYATNPLTYALDAHDQVIGEQPNQYILKVRDLPSPDKPREKLLQSGPGALTSSELLAIIWGVGTKKEEVMQMAGRVLKEYGEKALIHQTDVQALADSLEIPIGKASQIVASFELGRRYFGQKAGQPVSIRNADQAYHYLRGMGASHKEQLRGLYLGSRYQLVHDEVISIGSLTANIVHPREVFSPALEHGAVAIIIAHNHPSGSLEPTSEDLHVTTQLKAAGKLMGIDLLDHLIITDSTYASIINQQGA